MVVAAFIVIRAANLAIDHFQFKLTRRHVTGDLEWQRRAATLSGILTSMVAATVGFVPIGDLIWYQAGTRLRPYGYPNGFVPNIAHQHLLVLKKEARRAGGTRRE